MFIPLKSTFRQPFKNLIFILLVFLATFGFISRGVEYIILSREINRIEAFYSTTGSLVPINPMTTQDVTPVLALLEDSPQVAFVDNRSITQGVMDGIINTIEGAHTVGGTELTPGIQPFSYKGLYPFDTIMIIEANWIVNRQGFVTGNPDILDIRSLALRPVEVLHGPRQFTMMGGRQYQADFFVEGPDDVTIIDHLVPGEHYIVRATRWSPGSHTTAINFFPLYDDVYFVNVNDAAAVEKLWQTIDTDIIDENAQMLMLTGTRDMTALPMVQSGVINRSQGRMLTQEDYLEGNHVMVVPRRLSAGRQGARVGDTLTLTLRDMRTFNNGVVGTPGIPDVIEPRWPLLWEPFGFFARWHMTHGGAFDESIVGHWANIPAGYWVSIPAGHQTWQDYPTKTIEVEIVGSYVIHHLVDLPRWQHVRHSYMNMEVFVPASIIPEGWGIVDYVVSGQMSFALVNPGQENVFMATYGEALQHMGFDVEFFGYDPTNFFQSAQPIRRGIFVNLLLFTAVLVVLLAITVFLYLRMRHKEFAIMRALGGSFREATVATLLPVVLLWLPVVILSGVVAWFFALYQAGQSLAVLAQVDIPMDYGQHVQVLNILDQLAYAEAMAYEIATVDVSPWYLIGFTAVMVVLWFVGVLIATVLTMGKSMIGLIQSAAGGGAVPTARASAESIAADDAAQAKVANMSIEFGKMPVATSGGRLQAIIRHHGRYVARSRVKSTLALLVALLFVTALAWLNITIHTTRAEIERLYATTVIEGRLVSPHAGMDGDVWGHDIHPNSVGIIADSGFMDSYRTTALREIGVFPILPPAGEYELMNIESNLLAVAKSMSDWDRFIEDAHTPIAFGLTLGGEFEIEFLPGMDRLEFLETAAAVPIVVHESLLTTQFAFYGEHLRYDIDENGEIVTHTIALGDTVMLAGEASMFVPGVTVPARVVGSYRGGHPAVTYMMGQGLILLNENVRFTYNFAQVEFTMSGDNLRNMAEIEEELNSLLVYNIHHDPQPGVRGMWTENVSHRLELDDAEFIMVIAPLEGNLNLLELLYPIVIATSFVIAMALGLLIMLQNAKNVAILRVLGASISRIRWGLFAEQFALVFAGGMIGLITGLVLGVSFGAIMMLWGIYLAGAAIGLMIGVLIISVKPPIEMLQVKE